MNRLAFPPRPFDRSDLAVDPLEEVVDRGQHLVAAPVPYRLRTIYLRQTPDHRLAGHRFILGSGKIERLVPHVRRIGPFEPNETGVLANRRRGDEIELPPQTVDLLPPGVVKNHL